MNRMPTFEFHAPTNLAELTMILKKSNGETKILAGGTELIVNMKHGASNPEKVVWLGKTSGLSGIHQRNDGALEIGAMSTIADIGTSTLVANHCPALIDVTRSIATPAIRNRATIGGNLCLETRCYFYDQSEFWRGAIGGCLKLNIPSSEGKNICHAAPGLVKCSAVFSSDSATLLVALRSWVRLIGSEGAREIPLEDFYQNDGSRHRALKPGEVLSAIIIPSRKQGQRSAQKKMRFRRSIDYPIANVAVSLVVDEVKTCSEVSVVVGAVQSSPLRLRDLEEILSDKRLTPAEIERAIESVPLQTRPLANTAGTVAYRKKMVNVLLKRTLTELVSESV